MKKETDTMKEYFFWHNPAETGIRGEGFGYRTCRVKTIGWKWVRIQINISKNGRWHRIKRSVWNDITKQKRFRTIEEEQEHLDFCAKINEAGISWCKPYRKGKCKSKSRKELEEELRQSSGTEWKEAA